MIGVGFGYHEPSREQLIGAALDGLATCAKPARRLRNGQGITGEDAEGIPPRLRLTLLTGDLIRHPAEEACELEDVRDETGDMRIHPIIWKSDNMLSFCHTRTCYR